MRWRHLLAPAAVVLASCGGSPGDDPTDAGTSDGQPDTSLPDASDGDAGPEVMTEDAALDSAESEAGTDGSADAPQDTNGEDSTDSSDAEADADSSSDAPVSTSCGDGVRDPATEECDDGLDAGSRACTSSCTVVDRPVESDPSSSERRLGAGRHPVAGGPLGHAVALMETTSPDAGYESSVAVLTFSPVGEWLGSATIPGALLDADPVLAALPGGDYALAFASLYADGDELGITLCRIPNAGGTPTCAGSVTGVTYFSQRAPDLAWTGSELLLGWEDESTIPRQVCTRPFDADLQPTDNESCRGTGSTWQSAIALSSSAVAWREDASVLAELPSGTWISEPIGFPAWDEAPALAALDSDHTLIVYGDEQLVHRAAVLDSTGAVVFDGALNSASEPRRTPSVGVTEDGVYLVWQEPSDDPDPDAGWDPDYEELWLQRFDWDGSTLTGSAPPIPLPRTPSDQTGDQFGPRLAAVPYSAGGAVFAAWNHDGRDVIVELVPTPVLRKAMAY